MSEIKGNLLGIILTISIFGVVLAAMTAAFTSISKTVSDRAEAAVTEKTETDTTQAADSASTAETNKTIFKPNVE